MSLIEEALRRVKDPLIAHTETGTTPKTTPASQTPSTPQEAPAHSWSTASPAPRAASPVATPASSKSPALSITAAIVLLCTVLFLVGGVRWLAGTFGSSGSSKTTHAAPSATPAPRQQPVVEASEGVTLTGVVEGLGQPYAVINGQIVGLNESIGEWTVLAITEGTVIVSDRHGNETMLRVTR